MSTVLWESERTYVGEQENISIFSMCSELTPRSRIPYTRIPQFMQPWRHVNSVKGVNSVSSLYL